ncbi:formylglycine-generating enzyme family protein, partial [bacterium]|nr:formylglycine-generating enzyme family protein [bacterium]
TPTPIPFEPGEIIYTDTIVGHLRYIPAGDFIQGSPESEKCHYEYSETQFHHYLTLSYAVMETEVTRQMWADLKAVQACLPDDPTNTIHGEGSNNPVQMVTWFDAVLFANLLSLQNGFTVCYYKDADYTIPLDVVNYLSGKKVFCNFESTGFRLLSEGEWEYACRAGTMTAYNNGQDNTSCEEDPVLAPLAWYKFTSFETTHPVALKEPNAWNLWDMHGNVLEICWDWDSDYPEEATDYRGPVTGSLKMVRGGSWYAEAQHCRSAFRGIFDPKRNIRTIGFRLARTIK